MSITTITRRRVKTTITSATTIAAAVVFFFAAAAVFSPCASALAPSMASDCFFQDLGDASGAAWTVLSANRSVAVAASVPGQVHLDLMRAGLIGHPCAAVGAR